MAHIANVNDLGRFCHCEPELNHPVKNPNVICSALLSTFFYFKMQTIKLFSSAGIIPMDLLCEAQLLVLTLNCLLEI